MDKLRFGTAGIPLSAPESGTVNGIKHLRTLGLDCMELEFVRSVNIPQEKTFLVKKAAENCDIKLTCHGQYYINLNSEEKTKIEESQERILKAARIAWLCGAESLTFHAGFYLKKTEEETYQQIKKSLKRVVEVLKSENNHIHIRPETTGKPSQWGTLGEILRLSRELEQTQPCLDFSHLYARSSGKINSYEEFKKIIYEMEKSLGRSSLEKMHIHLSGIEYGLKGEKWHLNLTQCNLRYQELLKALKEFKCRGVVISESPNIEQDSLLMQKEYQKI